MLNAAITAAPSHGPAASAAIANAPYKTAQGIANHPNPSSAARRVPRVGDAECGALIGTARARFCETPFTQSGMRPDHSIAMPSTSTAACSIVHSGRTNALPADHEAIRPTAVAANAPAPM